MHTQKDPLPKLSGGLDEPDVVASPSAAGRTWKPSSTFGDFGLLLAVIHAIASITLALSVAYISYAIFTPRATLTEFAKIAVGFNTALVALAVLFVSPALWIVFRGRTPTQAARVATIAWRRLARKRFRWITTTVLAASLVLLITGWQIQRQPTKFETDYNELMFDIYQEQIIAAEAKLAQMRGHRSLLVYESSLVELAILALAVQRARVHRSLSVQELEAIRAKVEAWAGSQHIRDFDTLVLQGRLLLMLGRADASDSALRSAHTFALDAKQQLVVAMYSAETFMARRRYLDALQMLNLASAHANSLTNERRSIVFRKRGICKALLRDWNGAIEDFNRSLVLADHTRPIVLSNLGFALTAIQRYEEAVATLNQAITAAPTDPVPKMNLAIAHAEKQRFQLAKDTLQLAWQDAVTEIDRFSPASNATLIQLMRAWIQIRQNREYRTGVVEEIRKARRLPRNSEAVARIVRDHRQLVEEYLYAAESTLRHQNLHGLEFIAVDFLNEAKRMSVSNSVLQQVNNLLDEMPASALARALQK